MDHSSFWSVASKALQLTMMMTWSNDPAEMMHPHFQFLTTAKSADQEDTGLAIFGNPLHKNLVDIIANQLSSKRNCSFDS